MFNLKNKISIVTNDKKHTHQINASLSLMVSYFQTFVEKTELDTNVTFLPQFSFKLNLVFQRADNSIPRMLRRLINYQFSS